MRRKPRWVDSCPFVVKTSSTPHPQSLSPFEAEREELKPEFLKPIVHFLEMEVERAKFFEFAGLEM